MRTRALTFLPWTLGLWAVGVQVHELVATAGAWGTALLCLTLAWPMGRDALRPWALLLGFVGAAAIVPLLAGHLPSATGVARLADWLLVPAAACAVSRLNGKSLGQIGVAAGVTLVISVTLAALQHFGAWPGPDAFAGLSWTKLGFHRVYETVPGRDDRFMAGGLLLHRLKFANVTAAACVAGATAVAWRVPRWRFFAAATAVGLVGVGWFPHARAATAATVGAVAVTWVCAARDRRRAVLGSIALLIASLLLVLAVPSLRLRFSASLSAEGSGERAAITAAGVEAIRQHPLTGVGLDRFRPGLFTPPEAPAHAREHPGKAHNQFVTLAAEAGVPAVLLLLASLILLARRGLSALPEGALGVGAVGLFFLLALLHDPLFHPESSLALMLLLGAGFGAARRDAPVLGERR
ncbi:MAG: O-antigen ligase family protein [Myxococcota bacterium]